MMGFIGEVQLGFVVRIEGEFVGAWRRGGAFCKGIVSTARRRGVPFVRTKGTKIRSRGTDSPLTNPFQSLAVLDTNLDFSQSKNPNPYCAQIRSQGACGAFLYGVQQKPN